MKRALTALAIAALFVVGCNDGGPTSPTATPPPVSTAPPPVTQVFEFEYQGQVEPNLLLKYRVPVEKRVRVVGQAPIEDGNVSPTTEVMQRSYHVPCGTKAFAELIQLSGLVEQTIRVPVPDDCRPPVAGPPQGPTPPTGPTPPEGPENPTPPTTPPAPPPPPTCSLSQSDCPDGPFNAAECKCEACPGGEVWNGSACKSVSASGSVSLDLDFSTGNPTMRLSATWKHNCEGTIRITEGSGQLHQETNDSGFFDKTEYSWSQSRQCENTRKKVFATLSVQCVGPGTTDYVQTELELKNCQDIGVQ